MLPKQDATSATGVPAARKALRHAVAGLVMAGQGTAGVRLRVAHGEGIEAQHVAGLTMVAGVGEQALELEGVGEDAGGEKMVEDGRAALELGVCAEEDTLMIELEGAIDDTETDMNDDATPEVLDRWLPETTEEEEDATTVDTDGVDEAPRLAALEVRDLHPPGRASTDEAVKQRNKTALRLVERMDTIAGKKQKSETALSEKTWQRKEKEQQWGGGDAMSFVGSIAPGLRMFVSRLSPQ